MASWVAFSGLGLSLPLLAPCGLSRIGLTSTHLPFPDSYRCRERDPVLSNAEEKVPGPDPGMREAARHGRPIGAAPNA
jgi:hypothetical protein